METELDHSDLGVAKVGYKGRTFVMHYDNADDIIQKTHVAGRFYEQEELEYIGSLVPPGSHILDVGANVGNHSVFFAGVLRAKRVVPFEIQPRAIRILRSNVAANALSNVDLHHLGTGVGQREGWIDPVENANTVNNMGAQSFQVAEVPGAASIPVVAIDQLGLDAVDFVKIDVEGMEEQVVNGMLNTVRRYMPVLFIEVRRRDLRGLSGLVEGLGYRIERTFQRYRGVFNLIFFPKY